MPRIFFTPDPDLLPQLERYRREHMPNSGLNDVAAELVRIGLSRAPEAGLRDALTSDAARTEVSWFQERLRGFLGELRDESLKRSAGLREKESTE